MEEPSTEMILPKKVKLRMRIRRAKTRACSQENRSSFILLKKEADDASIELSDMKKPLSEEVKAPLSCSKKQGVGESSPT
jgi:hypothetical protein